MAFPVCIIAYKKTSLSALAKRTISCISAVYLQEYVFYSDKSVSVYLFSGSHYCTLFMRGCGLLFLPSRSAEYPTG
jgi:hypothetical protein